MVDEVGRLNAFVDVDSGFRLSLVSTVASEMNACAYFWPSLNFVRGFLYNLHMDLQCKNCIHYISISNIFSRSFRWFEEFIDVLFVTEEMDLFLEHSATKVVVAFHPGVRH